MWDSILFLELCCHSGQFLAHDDVVVRLCENPPDSFQGEPVYHCCQVLSLFCLQDLKAVVGAGLFGLIEGLDDDSDAAFVVRVFSVVPVEEGHSLLLVLARQPILDEILNLRDVHKLHVIHVAILLSFDDDVGRYALVAHGFGVGFVVFAGAVDLVSHSLGREAVVAFDLGGVHALAF